ncbi:MAG: hypothetical protein JNN27_14415 [Planctomycetes bacterium]|nr:hypothetical protein [Planctomycetota bacterium]
MSASDGSVADFLRARGCSAQVIDGGLAGLLARWAATVEELAAGYRWTFDDYLNDVDGRQILEEALEHAAHEERAAYSAALAVLDERADAWLSPPAECLWGAAVARAHGWTPERQWWYFRRPSELRDSAQETGLEGA